MIHKVHFIMQQIHTSSTPRAASSVHQRTFSKLARWEGKGEKFPGTVRKSIEKMAAVLETSEDEDSIIHLFDDRADKDRVIDWERAHKDPADGSIGLPEGLPGGDHISEDEEVDEVESLDGDDNDDESLEDRPDAAEEWGEEPFCVGEDARCHDCTPPKHRRSRFTDDALKAEASKIEAKMRTGVLKKCADSSSMVGACGCAFGFGRAIEEIANNLAEW